MKPFVVVVSIYIVFATVLKEIPKIVYMSRVLCSQSSNFTSESSLTANNPHMNRRSEWTRYRIYRLVLLDV